MHEILQNKSCTIIHRISIKNWFQWILPVIYAFNELLIVPPIHVLHCGDNRSYAKVGHDTIELIIDPPHVNSFRNKFIGNSHLVKYIIQWLPVFCHIFELHKGSVYYYRTFSRNQLSKHFLVIILIFCQIYPISRIRSVKIRNCCTIGILIPMINSKCYTLNLDLLCRRFKVHKSVSLRIAVQYIYPLLLRAGHSLSIWYPYTMIFPQIQSLCIAIRSIF